LSTVPPPLPDLVAPQPVRGERLGTVLAWVIILAAAGFIVAATALEKRAQPAGARAMGDISFRIAARYAVGVHHTIGRLQPAGAPSPAQSLLPEVDAAANTPDEKVEAAIVAGEIAGAPAATERLDKLAPNSADSPARDDVAALRALYAGGTSAVLTPVQGEALLNRHEWFGRLALSFDKPGDDPGRRAALRPPVRTALVLIAATLVGGAALLAGLALLVVGIVRRAGGKLPFSYHPPVAPTGPFLEAFAVYLAGMIAISALMRWVLGERLSSVWFVIVILPFSFFWPLLRGVPRGELAAGLGWHRGRGAWREIGAGFVGYLAGLPVLAVGGAITLVLTRYSGSDTSHPIVNELGRGAWRTVELFFLAAAWAPVVEETMFRGAFYHHLRRRLPWPVAAAAVALLFAAVHPQGWAAIPALGAIAVSLATIREWRGSIIASAVAHAINNGAVTVLMVLLLA
jgi:membrane protease YdiL (CAAX protease family)